MAGMKWGVRALTWAAGVALALSSAANAQEKSAIKEGFTFSKLVPTRILVFRPDVEVGSQSTGGLQEANADWTETARKLLDAELVAAQSRAGNTVVALPTLSDADARVLADYQ